MTQAEVETFLEALDNVQREENFGYSFFFVGEDHRLPFVTIANSDNEYDSVSNLDRAGVFRLNIGVSKETFNELLGEAVPADLDYTALDLLMPHPDYAKQHFVCILSPSDANADLTKKLMVEAHGIAAARLQRRAGR